MGMDPLNTLDWNGQIRVEKKKMFLEPAKTQQQQSIYYNRVAMLQQLICLQIVILAYS